jgi:hypothetical protein
MEFDVSKYELEDVSVLTVQNVKGTDDLIGADGVNPVTIELYGNGSEPAVKAEHKSAYQQQLRQMGLLRGKVDKRAGVVADQEEVDRLCARTKAINNFPLKPAEVYANTRLIYITKQVQAWIANDANFAKPSSASSPSTSGNEPG